MKLFSVFSGLDVLTEASCTRFELISKLRAAGKNYNFNKYTDAQLYRMVQKLQKPIKVVKEPEHDLDLDFEPADTFACCDFCGTRLTDFNQCPICDLGEEDLAEGIFDSKPSNLNSWVSASGQPVKLSQNSSSVPSNTLSQNTTSATNKYVVRIVSHGGRLRALATDGTHPAAFVAFPNNLRQFEGQKYEVDQLIWNGKNYRVSGNIVEII